MKILQYALIALACSVAGAQMQPWTTRSHDNGRSGWNLSETTLTQALVKQKGIVLKTIIPLCCDARGMEAQPLVVPKVKMAKDGSTHDVLLLPSMSNYIRAVDAHTGAGLWEVQLATPVTSTRQIDMWGINQHIGCLSTGVVDTDTNRLYQVCWVSQDGSGSAASGRYEMFVLNITSGAQAITAVPVQGTDTSMWKQRSSLVLTNVDGVKTVFFAHGSIYETSTGYTGGITAFDVATNTITASLPMTSGIWQAGQGLVADTSGYLYGITGNGDFNPADGFYGESFIKLQYTPASGASKAFLAVVDDWSPWTDYGRTGQPLPNDKMAGESLPSESIKPVGGNMSMSLEGATLKAVISTAGQPTVLVYPMATGQYADEDWGSAGPACILSLSICVATGKDGIGYPISTSNLGATSTMTVGTAANYAKLAGPCVWLTVDVGALPCGPSDPTTLNFFPGGKTAHLHMTPPSWNSPTHGWEIFPWGENHELHAWGVGATGKLSYLADGDVNASENITRAPGGMAGGWCSGSSNGNDPNSALMVCVVPYGDQNTSVTNGRLIVYDPEHFSTRADGSKQLAVLWDSQDWGIVFTANKFCPPVIDGGQIIYPDYAGRVLIFAITGN